jgi:hypothetical protein
MASDNENHVISPKQSKTRGEKITLAIIIAVAKRSDPEPIGSGSSQTALVRFMTPGP